MPVTKVVPLPQPIVEEQTRLPRDRALVIAQARYTHDGKAHQRTEAQFRAAEQLVKKRHDCAMSLRVKALRQDPVLRSYIRIAKTEDGELVYFGEVRRELSRVYKE